MLARPPLEQVKAMLDAGRAGDAARLLANAARQGNVSALMELAQWCIAGVIIPRDLARARDLLRRAGEAGHEAAALLYASFLASETGGDADWPGAVAALRALASRSPRARAQLDLIGPMDLDQHGRPAHAQSTERLSDTPCVLVCRSFATGDECRHLIDAGAPFLQPAVVVDPASGRMVPHPVRRSDGAMFGVHIEDLIVSAINRRIAALSSTEYRQGEPLQLLRYGRGGEYRAHMDALPSEPNQRILTVILYLNDNYRGGETQFLRTGLTFRGKTGDALVFRNVTSDGRADPMSLHAGAPVTNGTKLIATRWIRQAPFSYPPPRPILSAIPGGAV